MRDAMFSRQLFYLGGMLAFAAASALAQDNRIQQARAAGRLDLGTNPAAASTRLDASDVYAGRDDGSFGVQQLLRQQPSPQTFFLYSDVAVLATSNAALTRREAKGDVFLVPTFGFGYNRALVTGLRLEAEVSLTAFRYSSFSRLDFNDLEARIGLNYHAERFGGLDFYAGYRFTDLSTRSGDWFFHSHAIELSAQKTFALSATQSLFLGVGAEIDFADPELSERSEYSAFAGYRLAVRRRWNFHLLYRYAYYDYSEGGRGDHNQTVSLGARYRFSERVNAYATSYFTLNRSNQSEFNYEAATAGIGLTLKLSF